MAVRTPPAVEANGGRPTDISPASLAKPRQRRPILVVVGLLFVLLAALAGAVVFGSLTTTTSVLVAATDLEPGEVVEAGDLRVVELSNLGDADVVRASAQTTVIGRVARGPIPAGTVLNADLFGLPGTAIPAGMTVVGAALERGAVPGPSLAAGDRVDVLGVVGGGVSLDRSPDLEAVVLARGMVWAVERPSSTLGGRIVVSLLVPIDAQTVVAQAAADNRLRLALTAAE